MNESYSRIIWFVTELFTIGWILLAVLSRSVECVLVVERPEQSEHRSGHSQSSVKYSTTETQVQLQKIIAEDLEKAKQDTYQGLSTK